MNYDYNGYGGVSEDGEPNAEERARQNAELENAEPANSELYETAPEKVPGFDALSAAEPTASEKTLEPPAMRTPERAEHAATEHDWREAEYREYSPTREQAYTPGIPNGPLYAPPRRERREMPRPPRAERPRRGGGFLRGLCLVLVCAVIGAASGLGAVWYGLSSGLVQLPRAQVVLGAPVAQSPEDPDATPTPISGAGETLSGTDIYRLAAAQVVSLSTTVPSQGFFGGNQSNTVYGSGFIISEDGYILTNYHVVQYAIDYGYELVVGMRDGTTYTASVVGGEQDNDVAVVKIDASWLSPVTVGSSAAVQVGEVVYAVGNPRRLDHTMTDGIISALDREVQVETNMSIAMFQISAAVNSGNSGGPVYNDRGEVIGIVSAKYASVGTEGLGFAIPIDDAMSIASDLIEYGYVSGKAYIGVTVQTVKAVDAEYYNLPMGAFVMSVEEGSCAEKAGIKQGDIITRLGQTPVSSTETLQTAKRDFKAGETTVVEVFRGGETVRLDITFDEVSVGNKQTQNTPQITMTPSVAPN
jgi:serine protease Do